MTGLKQIEQLAAAGRFTEALIALEGLPVTLGKGPEVDVLRAELLERVGRYSQSRAIAERTLQASRTSGSARSACELTLGLIEVDESRRDSARHHLRRASTLAEASKDLKRLVLSQLYLVLYFEENSPAFEAGPLLSQLRRNVVRLGDPVLTATLHVFLGILEAKRGLLLNAQRHIRLGVGLLTHHENLWLEALAENTLVAVDIMRFDLASGIERSHRALGLGQQSGAALVQRASLGNLGNLYYMSGDFEKAIEYLRLAQAALPTIGDQTNGALDSLARVYLRTGHFDKALECLRLVEGAITSPEHRLSYVNRHSQLTHAELLARQGLLTEALEVCERTLSIARSARDHVLTTLALLQKADLLNQANRPSESIRVLTDVTTDFLDQTPEAHAYYERVVCCVLLSAGDSMNAQAHFRRAQRAYQGLHNAPGLLDLEDAWEDARRRSRLPEISATTGLAGSQAACHLVHDVAAVMMHVGRAELVATSLVSILAESGAVVSVSARSRGDDGTIETLASSGAPKAARQGDAAAERTIAVGSVRDRKFEVVLTPRGDIDSLATVNAVLLLLDHVRDLERAHLEREERLTLWPVEEVPVEDDQAVLGGAMLKLMESARKMATIKASVLITGESGTGKEILARAIHRYSARADKPFVPFNSAAVPREMLESHLFGHRRGAFTGADRDGLGLIRAAKDGTLFLDEIGELSLELQPKLLRFLESGEINPLGEPSPFNVDVRIIAATNANLEQLVQEGRFREDLFYRLNVFPLPIPPLRERRDEIPALVHYFVARHAAEYGKGRLRIAEETMEHLMLFPWPGNVRQLHHELQRMVALADDDSVLTPASLSVQVLRATPKVQARPPASADPAPPPRDKLAPTLARIEREIIQEALASHDGRIEAAAKSLGISRKGLYLKRQRLGL